VSSVKMIMKPCLTFSFNVGRQRIFDVNFVIFWASILIILRQAIFFKVFDQGWSPQIKDLILAAITNIIWTIWHERIMIKFRDKRIAILLKLINWSYFLLLYLVVCPKVTFISLLIRKFWILFFLSLILRERDLLSFWFIDILLHPIGLIVTQSIG